MTFVMMPAVTRVLRPWLRRNPGVIRKERSLLEALDSRAARTR
jgi:antibiotic biosynthesis monooxygenase (ABM) superfamily enzyme